MRNLGRYRKFIVALLGAAAVIGAELPASAPSWLTGTFAVLSAIGVYFVRNDTPAVSRQDLAGRVGTRAVRPEDRRPFDGP